MIPQRVMGIETEYGLMCASTRSGEPPLDPEAAAAELFRPMVDAGQSTNSFLRNGARLYLDVGAHPEYATAECRRVADLVANDRAGDLILCDMAAQANARLVSQGIPGEIHLFKNNVDSRGNSYGCHENYLVHRRPDYRTRISTMLPFFVTRQLIVGAGYIKTDRLGQVSYCFSQRADQMWDAISSASTRSRPMINTRDEPHGNPELYRRMHVIVGDSNICEVTTALKIAMTQAVLVMLEDGGVLPRIDIKEPVRAIRAVSGDLSGNTPIELTDGSTISAVEVQLRTHEAVMHHFEMSGYMADLGEDVSRLFELWGRVLDAVVSGDYTDISQEIDWAAKYALIKRYMERSGVDLRDSRVARLDLAYHDITAGGLRDSMESGGLLKRFVTEQRARESMTMPPQDTRAKIRGDFIARAEELRLDYTANWMNLRLLDAEGHRTVVLKDPFAAADACVDELMERMGK